MSTRVLESLLPVSLLNSHSTVCCLAARCIPILHPSYQGILQVCCWVHCMVVVARSMRHGFCMCVGLCVGCRRMAGGYVRAPVAFCNNVGMWPWLQLLVTCLCCCEYVDVDHLLQKCH
jgi:hypothetical protein